MTECEPCSVYWHPEECRTCETRDDEGALVGVALDEDGACPRCKKRFSDPGACYVCGKPGTPRTFGDVLDDAARPVPELDLVEAWLWETWHLPGRDGDGRPLLAEQRELLELLGFRCVSQKRLLLDLWQVITTTVHSERKRRLDNMDTKGKEKP